MDLNKIEKKLDKLFWLYGNSPLRYIKPIKEHWCNKINFLLYMKRKKEGERRECLMKKRKNTQESKGAKFQYGKHKSTKKQKQKQLN